MRLSEYVRRLLRQREDGPGWSDDMYDWVKSRWGQNMPDSVATQSGEWTLTYFRQDIVNFYKGIEQAVRQATGPAGTHSVQYRYRHFGSMLFHLREARKNLPAWKESAIKTSTRMFAFSERFRRAADKMVQLVDIGMQLLDFAIESFSDVTTYADREREIVKRLKQMVQVYDHMVIVDEEMRQAAYQLLHDAQLPDQATMLRTGRTMPGTRWGGTVGNPKDIGPGGGQVYYDPKSSQGSVRLSRTARKA